MHLHPDEAAYVHAVHTGDTAGAAEAELVLTVAALTPGPPTPAGAVLAAALAYAAAGVAVFPCQGGGKSPVVQNGFKDASTDPARVRSWFAGRAVNIGIPTGLGFDVIDVDGLAGLVSLLGGDDPLVGHLDVIAHALTPRLAGHHLFVAPTGAGNKAGVFTGIDYRGVGGYVIAAPSVGSNGRPYTWVTPLPALATS